LQLIAYYGNYSPLPTLLHWHHRDMAATNEPFTSSFSAESTEEGGGLGTVSICGSSQDVHNARRVLTNHIDDNNNNNIINNQTAATIITTQN